MPRRTLVAGLALAMVLTGCTEDITAVRRIRADDCLREVNLNQLDQALRRCDRVVAAFPTEPAPLNERFVLHILKGNHQAACRDNAHALALARSLPPGRLSLQLRSELEVRQQSCR